MKRFETLAISNPDELYYGYAPTPLTTKRGLIIGGGTVYPELNFTLPAMLLNDTTYPKARDHYRQMVTEGLDRALELEAPGVVIEFETLPDMTQRPDWAEELAKIMIDAIEDAHAKGLAGAFRMTPNDNREMVRPPSMRSGEYWENMLETFERTAALGSDLLSIESVGGKEIHDQALTYCDLRQVLFSQCILGVRDMEFLWGHIVDIADKHDGVFAAGDTACGFANTAMVLADRKMIPQVFAAVVRAISAVRSLVAYEMGAVGPGKDCGYENIILKAITGLPMSLEGKTAACAHLSSIGNVSMAYGDLWSNESVQNIKLLGGMAPTVSMEQLIYDCRLMNEARAGVAGALQLRDWLVRSDAPRDAQAFIFTPDNAIALAQTIVDAPNHYQAGVDVSRKTIEILRAGKASGQVKIPEREMMYVDIMAQALDTMPESEEEFISQMMREVDLSKIVPADYLLPTE